MENLSIKARNKISIQYGIILSFIYILLVTLINTMVGNIILFNCARFIIYVIYFIVMGVFISRIKKANGGFLEFKETYASVIVISVVSCLIYYAYSVIYLRYINPQILYQLKASTISFMENYKVSDNQLDKTSAEFDKQIADAKIFNVGKNILNYFESVIIDCLFGLLVALAVKKNKPAFFNEQSVSN